MTRVDEEQAGEDAHRVLDLIESGRREELVQFMNGLDRGALSLVVLAIGLALVEQEARNGGLEVRNGILQAQNETLETANIRLFADRRQLMDRVDELREIQRSQAEMLAGKRERKAKVA